MFDTKAAPPSDWNAPSEIWAQNLVGDWKNNSFSLDLTKKIDRAAQYRLRFIPKSGSVTGFKDVVLKLHGVSEPDLLKRPMQPDELLLDITGVAETVEISGKVEGAAMGEILLQKL